MEFRRRSRKLRPMPAEQWREKYREWSADNFMLFLRGLYIPSASGSQLFDDCIADFQMETFQLLAPSLKAIRDGTMPPKRRFWVERTKKAGKDSDLAICLLWLMAYPKRPILVQVSAANQQQSGIVKRRALHLIYYNPWLEDYVTVQQNRIYGRNRLGEVVIEATGAAGAKQGDTPDLLILNELVHVDKWAVNETHMANADGVPQGVVIVSTNAGIKGTPAELWRKNAQGHPKRWTMLLWSKRAPWISAEDVEDARRRDPVGVEYDRLWRGIWRSGRGDAVTEDAIEKCFRLPDKLAAPETGWRYLAGLDLGISHDHSGLVLIGVHPEHQRVRVGWLRGYVPTIANDKGQLEVDSDVVERDCLEIQKRFRVEWFGYDPAAGGSFMAQRLRRKGVPMREVSFSSPKNCCDMATSFISAVNDGKLECYEDPEGRMRRDMGKFRFVAVTGGGYKLVATSDEWGHADVGTALVICLPQAVRMLGANRFSGDDAIAYEDVGELSEKELEEMPEELRDIMDTDGKDGYEDGDGDFPRNRRFRF